MAKHEFIFGQHAVASVITTESDRVLELFVLKTREDAKTQQLLSQARRAGIPIQFCHKKTLDDKAEGQQHQGVIARTKPAPVKTESDLNKIIQSAIENNKLSTLLILDGITDPHNLGACMRTADAAGVDAVVVPKDRSASLSGTVRKVACGAAEVLPLIQVTNLARTLRDLQQQGVWIVGTAGEADQSLFDVTLDGHIALVMGAEDKGMRRLTRETCDQLVKLPMSGSVSSLNVSVATGICLYELKRQRLSQI